MSKQPTNNPILFLSRLFFLAHIPGDNLCTMMPCCCKFLGLLCLFGLLPRRNTCRVEETCTVPSKTSVPILWSISSTQCNKLVLEVSRVRSAGSPLKTWLVGQYRTCDPELKSGSTKRPLHPATVLGASPAIGSPYSCWGQSCNEGDASCGWDARRSC